MEYLTRQELRQLDFVRCGRDVNISRRSVLYGTDRISIGDHVRIDDMSIVFADAPCHIGSYVHIGAYAFYGGRHGITMDDFSGIGQRVSIFTANDDFSGKTLTNPTVPAPYAGSTTGPVRIDRHAIIGTGTVILPGVHIGEGVAVGALSLVAEDLAPWAIYAGSPARRLKGRSRQLLEVERDLRAHEDSAP